jgi:hypothetical protein
MRSARTGYATLAGPDGLKEKDTFTCAHCQAIRHVKPFCDPADLGGLCKTCMGVICERCLGGVCDPILKKIERAEKRAQARRWMNEAL